MIKTGEIARGDSQSSAGFQINWRGEALPHTVQKRNGAPQPGTVVSLRRSDQSVVIPQNDTPYPLVSSQQMRLDASGQVSGKGKKLDGVVIVESPGPSGEVAEGSGDGGSKDPPTAKDRGNEWWEGGNIAHIFESTVDWDNGPANFEDSHRFARALGFGDFANEEEFGEWLRKEGRMGWHSFSRMKDGDGYLYEMRRGSKDKGRPEFYIRSDGLWVPFSSGYILDGQKFDVRTNGFERDSGTSATIPKVFAAIVGEEIANQIKDLDNHAFSLMQGNFSPNEPVSQNFGPGGTASFIYIWDRLAGTLTLRKVTSDTFGAPVSQWGDSPLAWSDTNGHDTPVTIKPYGLFRIPGSLSESDLLKNLLFPRSYPWYDEEETGVQLAYTEQNHGYNLFDIKFVRSWTDGSFTEITANL